MVYEAVRNRGGGGEEEGCRLGRSGLKSASIAPLHPRQELLSRDASGHAGVVRVDEQVLDELVALGVGEPAKDLEAVLSAASVAIDDAAVSGVEVARVAGVDSTADSDVPIAAKLVGASAEGSHDKYELKWRRMGVPGRAFGGASLIELAHAGLGVGGGAGHYLYLGVCGCGPGHKGVYHHGASERSCAVYSEAID